jgi:hypothetical protein
MRWASIQASFSPRAVGKTRWSRDMILTVVAVLMVLHLGGELLLDELNRREVRRHAAEAPPAVAAMMDAAN